jgi:hypothetical protein
MSGERDVSVPGRVQRREAEPPLLSAARDARPETSRTSPADRVRDGPISSP